MADKQNKEIINWLLTRLETKGTFLSGLMTRLRDVSFRRQTDPTVHKKFLRLLWQISVEREKELRILQEIETIEKRHATLRQNARLKRIAEEKEHEAQKRLKADEKLWAKPVTEEKPKSVIGLLLVVYLALFSRRDPGLGSQKN